MSFFNQLFNPIQHCEDAVINLCRRLKVNISESTLKKELLHHPDYPSLMSIGDVLNSYGVANQGLKLNIENFDNLPLPFIAYTKSRQLSHNIFVPVYAMMEDSFEVYNPETRNVELWERNRFGKDYLGTIMLVEANENSGEKDYEIIVKKEQQKSIFNYSIAFLLPLIVLVSCIVVLLRYPAAVFTAPIMFTLLNLVGCAVCTLLLWHEIDEYNPALKQVCHASTKINCSAVLNTDGAKIFGQSWSSIGFCYFMGSLIALLVSGVVNLPVLELLGWMNVLALPYIVYSIYYQWQIARQWCLLCLIVQCVLLLQFIVSLAGGLHTLLPFGRISATAWLAIAVSFAFVYIVTSLLMPTLEKAKESREKTVELQRLKHNPQIFEALLTKEKAVEHSTDGLGISLGNPAAKYKLIKVCNPYCGPCSKAHPTMEKLIEINRDVKLQIIFTATTEPNDIATPIVRHLLAIAEKGNEVITQKALDDWYLSETKDYKVFSEKYPLNGELLEQDGKIERMREWCKAMDVVATPTFFVSPVSAGGNDGHHSLYQLPKLYTVGDLKNLFVI